MLLYCWLALAGSLPRAQGEPWPELFESLARLEQMAPRSKEFQKLSASLSAVATERERDARKAKDSVGKYRSRVILFHLQRVQGLPTRTAPDPGSVLAWLPREAWYATRALAPGPMRVETAIVSWNETLPDPERAAWLVRVCGEERLALHLDQAERCALALEERAPNADNAERLARILVLRGNAERARSVLTDAIDATGDESTRLRLLVARARASAAAQRERAALEDWGSALAGESDDAALDLAARALAEGERDRALALATLALARSPARDEALVSFGRALLPATVPAQPIPLEPLPEKRQKVP